MSTTPISGFWQCNGLSEEDMLRCLQLVRERYVGYKVDEFVEQGYCSLTLLVSIPQNTLRTGARSAQLENNEERNSFIVQIRPTQYELDMNITRAAKETFSSLAPDIQIIDLELPGQLRVYEMQRKRGTPLSRLLPRTQDSNPNMRKKQERLVESFATLIAHSWHSSSKLPSRCRNTRADSPMEEEPRMLSDCTGKVGSSITARLEKLGNELPQPRLQEIAKTTLARIKAMDHLPVVLNHGDLIPSNILVDEDTWEITGLVDWAEAEHLPFGTCLYGLEYVLGYITTTAPQTADSTSKSLSAPGFVYHEHAAYLRELFWTRLCEVVPNIGTRLEDIKNIRDMGVLLWYGYAWDDGVIDRVVNGRDDAVEVACLRAFLDVP